MKKKNQLPIKWIIGIVIALIVAVQWSHHASTNDSSPASSHISSQNDFFQFMASLFGMGGPNASSGEAAKGHNASNQNSLNSPQTGGLNSADQQDQNSMNDASGSAMQGSAASQQGNHGENNSGGSSEGNSEMNAEDSSANNSENNSGLNAENTSSNNPASNSESNADQEQGNLAENPPANSDNNSGNNSGNSSNDNSENNPDQGTGNNPTDNSGGSGNNPGGNSGGNAPGSPNQNSFPVINPIPSDDTATQSIAQQNQHADALAAELSSRQALVAPVVQQAQATKYQSPTYNDIPTPTTTSPSADTIAKVQSKQYSFH